MDDLKELRSIIYCYDNFCDCWMSGMDPEEYCEEMDNLRNRALEILKKLEEKA